MDKTINAQSTPSVYKDIYTDDILGRKLLFNPLARKNLVVVGPRIQRILKLCNGSIPLGKIAELENLSLEETILLVEKLTNQAILSLNARSLLATPTKKKKIFRVWVHITNNCNLACHYCYIKKDASPMPRKIVRKTIDSINNSVSKHRDFIDTIRYVISGGEPLTNFPAVQEFLEYSRFVSTKSGIRKKTSLLTNGTIFSLKIASVLKKHNVGISISLDGLRKANCHRVFPDGKPSVDIVLKNIDRFAKFGIRPYILITVTPENFKKLPTLTRYLMGKGLGFRYSLLTDLETGKDVSNYSPEIIHKLNECFDLIEKMMIDSPSRDWLNINFQTIPLRGGCTRACGIGHNLLAISHDGKVYLCHTDINKKRPISDIDSKDIIRDLWNQNSFPELRFYKGVQDYEGCSKCYWRFQCGGSCSRFTKVAKGRLNTKSPHCDIVKAMIPRILRIRALNLIKKGGGKK